MQVRAIAKGYKAQALRQVGDEFEWPAKEKLASWVTQVEGAKAGKASQNTAPTAAQVGGAKAAAAAQAAAAAAAQAGDNAAGLV